MNTQHKTQRGRPPLGRTRMVTIGIRMEPTEREQLEALATNSGHSLCGYLREVIRRELAQDSDEQVPLAAAG
ncbi:MAG: plasmid mobilization protein [Gammaproteobacteria bacterium]